MFGIVILHFNVLEQTIACVSSVLNGFKKAKFHIAVVDNGSINKSGKILKEFYKNNNHVSVIYNKKNFGFAKGMNTGIEFLKQKFRIHFFILLNNDTEIIGGNWSIKIEEKYAEYKFAVLGPDIINLDGIRHCNPAKIQMNSKRDLELLIREKKRMIFKYRFYIEPFASFIIRYLKKVIKKLIRYHCKRSLLDYQTECINVQLQGSCLILSEQYFKYYEKLFDNTFLYFEEAILKYLCDKKKLVSLYCPDIKLLHKEGRATDTITKDYRERRLFYLKNSLESCEKFLEWMQMEENS